MNENITAELDNIVNEMYDAFKEEVVEKAISGALVVALLGGNNPKEYANYYSHTLADKLEKLVKGLRGEKDE